MIRLLLLAALMGCASVARTQGYTSWLTGDPSDAQGFPVRALTLMGGASENDEAMSWFLSHASQGDVVVIRTSGSDGYNEYLFNLGPAVNSVETIRFDDASASEDPYVLERLEQAEAIWIAGGDQATYVDMWQGTSVEAILNDKLLQVPVGGISAGMAILGNSYFSAANGTTTTAECLADPFNDAAAVAHDDFLELSAFGDWITDTHYDDPDRRGRHAVFLGRMWSDAGKIPLGIACDEFAAVCIDYTGTATCFGEYPEFDDYVYFLRPGCPEDWTPETLNAGVPVTWNRNGEALAVFRAHGTTDGSSTFDLNSWDDGTDGAWQHWWIDGGVLNTASAPGAPNCDVPTGVTEAGRSANRLWPNPASHEVWFTCEPGTTWEVRDLSGKVVAKGYCQGTRSSIGVKGWRSGIYQFRTPGRTQRFVVTP